MAKKKEVYYRTDDTQQPNTQTHVTTRAPTPIPQKTERKIMCDCFATCGRLFLTVFNLIFSIFGIVLLALGGIVKANSPMVNALIAAGQAKFTQSVASAGYSMPMDNFSIHNIVGGLAIGFIAVGCAFLFIGLLGVLGACCKIRSLLILYVICITIVLLAQVGLAVSVFAVRNSFDSTVKKNMKTILKSEYTGINGTSAGNLAMNFIMTTRGCCGVDDYNDFSIDNAPNWQFRSFRDASGNTQTLITPMVCCKNTSEAPTCAKNPDATNPTKNNFNKGCYDALWDWVMEYKDISVIVVAAICGIQLVWIIFGISIIRQIDRES